MKRLLWIFSFLFLACQVFSQKVDPAHWSFRLDTGSGKTLTLRLTATLDAGWHIYSQNQPAEAVAQPTKIVFAKNPLIRLTGKATEDGYRETYQDKSAGITQYQYGGKVDFVQKLMVTHKAKTTVTGTITYQTCTDEMCLPPKTVPFSVSLE